MCRRHGFDVPALAGLRAALSALSGSSTHSESGSHPIHKACESSSRPLRCGGGGKRRMCLVRLQFLILLRGQWRKLWQMFYTMGSAKDEVRERGAPLNQ